MSHTYAQNVLHVVFSTKNRRKQIPADFQPQLWLYSAGICKRCAIRSHAIGGIDDHLHLLLQIPPALPLAKAVATIKSNTARWAREQGHQLTWQEGYAAFSVSASQIPIVTRYVQNQKSHHQKMNFDTEFLALLKKHAIPYDPKFVLG